MMLSVARANALLNRVGQLVGWRRAFDCPCTNDYSGAAISDCGACSGNGVIWNPAQTGKVALAGQKVQREWANFGLWESGDVILSIPSDSPVYALGENDRVVLSESSEPFSETVTHTATSDRLPFPVVVIDRVFWLGANDVIVEGGIPTLDAQGVLTWASGEPPIDTEYSITGRKRPEYFCFKEFPQDRAHQGGLTLPRRVVLRRFDVFGRSTS